MATTKLKVVMAIGGATAGSGLGSAIYISTWNTIGDKLRSENYKFDKWRWRLQNCIIFK